jgi:hypothetical protein
LFSSFVFDEAGTDIQAPFREQLCNTEGEF